ncbi:hypothetical protein ACFOY8_14925 [Thalassospira xianhensis]|uniref:Uncharacterized protein n=1 Tax=Thalassospira xianhensis MCCC 1A02616 TaxID=1177929 RepID=A0A367UHS9_9PROT|nr:hypothetical protein [Thalassospira xianhensis]RCK07561.1 hypothetical protein TH5_00300 [Thalassospira xianhensis MCCC 1A02616]
MTTSHIIVDYPFTYEAAIVPPGKRNLRRFEITDKVPVRLPAIEAEDFPIAFRIAESRQEGKYVDYRFHEGRFYVATTPKVTEAEFIAKVAAEDNVYVPVLFHEWTKDIPSIGYYGNDATKKIKSNEIAGQISHDNRRESVTAVLDNLPFDCIFSDGQLWRVAYEPVWKFSPSTSIYARGKENSSFDLDVCDSAWMTPERRSQHWQYHRIFGLDELEVGKQVIVENEFEPDENFDIKCYGDVEILRPDLLQHRLPERRIIAKVSDFMGRIRSLVYDASVGYFEAYAKLRDEWYAIIRADDFSTMSAELTPGFLDAIDELLARDDHPALFGDPMRPSKSSEYPYGLDVAVEQYRRQRMSPGHDAQLTLAIPAPRF